jgi:hypothetical protein
VQAQLAALLELYRTATVRLHQLRSAVSDAHWTERPGSGGWSVAECVAHLNLTSAALAPRVEGALEAARTLGPARGRYRRDPMGWLLCKVLPPPVRFKLPSTASFIPESLTPPSELVAEFERHQAEFVRVIRESEGLRIDQVRVTSPFNARAQYNLYAALTIIPLHQHRHLWQGEEVWKSIQAG